MKKIKYYSENEKMTDRMGERFANYISDKGIISGKYKTFLQI